jgi:hypothetical protein
MSCGVCNEAAGRLSYNSLIFSIDANHGTTLDDLFGHMCDILTYIKTCQRVYERVCVFRGGENRS